MIQGRSPERGDSLSGGVLFGTRPKKNNKRFAATLRFAFIALIMRFLIG